MFLSLCNWHLLVFHSFHFLLRMPVFSFLRNDFFWEQNYDSHFKMITDNFNTWLILRQLSVWNGSRLPASLHWLCIVWGCCEGDLCPFFFGYNPVTMVWILIGEELWVCFCAQWFMFQCLCSVDLSTLEISLKPWSKTHIPLNVCCTECVLYRLLTDT